MKNLSGRKITQVVPMGCYDPKSKQNVQCLFAQCDDGTLWQFDAAEGDWVISGMHRGKPPETAVEKENE